ncbi:MAG: RNA-binding protein [Pseudomonadota bacterium]|nr:RNA-binding protein [Pseudomonadota bacterium]
MNPLDRLQHCPDIATLKPALHRLCAKFGRVTRLDVLTSIHEGTRQAICFLRLDSPETEQLFMQTLGVGRFGGEIVFVVNLGATSPGEAQGPSSQWSAFDEDTMRPSKRANG